MLPGMEAGTSVNRIPSPMLSLWLRRYTMIVFVPLTVRLLIRTSISWATTIHCWNLTRQNSPALSPKFIGNVRRMIVALATVCVYTEKAVDETTRNVAKEKSRQQNARVEMCKVKYFPTIVECDSLTDE